MKIDLEALKLRTKYHWERAPAGDDTALQLIYDLLDVLIAEETRREERGRAKAGAEMLQGTPHYVKHGDVAVKLPLKCAKKVCARAADKDSNYCKEHEPK